MSSELEQSGSALSTAAGAEPEHEYLGPLTKRVRALKKKLSNVSDIEAKQKAGSKINSDQQLALDSKEGLTKSLAELESLHSQYAKVNQQAEKLQKRLKKKAAADADADKQRERGDAARQIVELFQVSQHGSAAEGPRLLADMLITKSGGEVVAIALKYLSRSNEELAPGLSFKAVAEQVGHALAPATPVVPEAAAHAEEAHIEVAPVAGAAAAAAEEPEPAAAQEAAAAQEGTQEDAAQPTGFDAQGSEGMSEAVGEWGATPLDTAEETPADNGGWSNVGESNSGGAQHAGRGRGRGSSRGRGDRGQEYRGRGGEYRGRGGEYRGRGGDRPRGEYRGRGGSRGGESGYRGRGGDGGYRGRGGFRGANASNGTQ